MAQCAARSQRSGERCKRSASPGASTCYYHGPAAGQTKRVAARREALAESREAAPGSGALRLTTKELSERTWPDFETLFAEGTGWGRCACLAPADRVSPRVAPTWAEQRLANLDTKRGRVEQGRARGILVYHSGAPVGWCRFGSRDEEQSPISAGSSRTVFESDE